MADELPILPTSPRLTGRAEDDIVSILNWSEQIYEAMIGAFNVIYTKSEVAALLPRKKAIKLVTSATYTITEDDGTILVNASSAAVTVTLPEHEAGRIFTVLKTDSSGNAVTLKPGSGTINGATTQSTTTQYGKFTVQSDGTNWFIIA